MPGPCEAAASDAITSTYPRRSITCGRQARTVRKTPSRLTSMVRSKASGSIERTKPVGATPAFAITTSMPPKRSTTDSTTPARASVSVTSASNAAASGPHCCATRASSSGSSPTRAIRAPRAASWRAVSAPIPRAAPVMRMVLPRRSMAGAL